MRVLQIALFVFCILGGGIITAVTVREGVAKTAPPAHAPAFITQAGRLEVTALPGDNLFPLALSGFTVEPVVVCSPANDAHMQTSCQALTPDSAGVWVYNPYDVPITFIVNWIAEGS